MGGGAGACCCCCCAVVVAVVAAVAAAIRAAIAPESLPAAGHRGLPLVLFVAGAVGRVIHWLFRDIHALRFGLVDLALIVSFGHRRWRRGLRDAARFGREDDPVHIVRVCCRTQHHVVEVGPIQQGCQNVARRPGTRCVTTRSVALGEPPPQLRFAPAPPAVCPPGSSSRPQS